MNPVARRSLDTERRRGPTLRSKETGSRLQKNNTRDSNVVPHRSTNLARRCLTSLSRREAVLSSWYGRSCLYGAFLCYITCTIFFISFCSLSCVHTLKIPLQFICSNITKYKFVTLIRTILLLVLHACTSYLHTNTPQIYH